MSKTTAISIALLTACLGLVAGVIVMSSQVEASKKEKEEAKAIEKQANETVIYLRRELSKANKIKEKLEQDLVKLRKQLEQCNAHKLEASTDTTLNESKKKENGGTKIIGGFIYRNVRIYRGKNYLTGEADDYPAMIVGEMTNDSGKNYDTATFNVSVYDRKNHLLAVDSIYINNFMHNQTKSFSGIVSCNCSLVSKYKIDFDSGSLLDE